jgi:hypothetical protein
VVYAMTMNVERVVTTHKPSTSNQHCRISECSMRSLVLLHTIPRLVPMLRASLTIHYEN